jgi:nitrite reductase/ring-hydroxylating ferredoxin subunit
VTPHLGTWYRLGPVAQIPIGEGRAFAVGTAMVAVFRLRDGRLRAVSAVCPHAGGPIADGLADQVTVICPLHQNSFDLATGCSTSGAPPLTVYPVHADPDGELLVGLPADD